MATEEDSAPTRAQQFGEYVAAAARAAGFDIDSPRGGGKKAIADKAGMSHATVSRMLAGRAIPEPAYLERLAEVLDMPLMELLVRSGIVSRDGSRTLVRSVPPDEPFTPEAAARLLGIRSPDRVQMFAAMTKTLADQEVDADDGESVGTGSGA